MCKYTNLKFAAVVASALLASACGGGSAGGDRPLVAPPPPPPPPAVTRHPNAATGVIYAAETSTTFASQGENLHANGNLTVRYDAPTDQYYVAIPGEVETDALLAYNLNQTNDPTSAYHWYTAGGGSNASTSVSGTTSDPERNYLYSNLASFWNGSGFGDTAFGIATLASAVPATGTASYSGILEGRSSEQVDWGGWGIYAGSITGPINLTFNFGSGDLSGTLHPILELDARYDLGTLTVSQPVWGVGSAGFSGSLTGSILTGDPAGIRGQFTGPAAEELIGAFFFGYVSPVTGLDARAAGAFVAQR